MVAVVEHVDVIVVGAGPAGATAAVAVRHARPTADVLLLDRATFPRDKACGDGIAPHAFEELARLGVHGVEAGYPPVWDLRLRGPAGEEIVGRGRRPNRVIPRAVFDARLVDAAVAAGARAVTHRVRRVAVDAAGVTVDGRYRAPVLIAADGANSTVRRALGVAPNPPRHVAIAVRGYAPAPVGPLQQRITLVPQGWPAYWWSFPIGDGRANIGYGLRVSELDGGGRAELHGRLAAYLPDQPAEEGSLRAHHLPLSTHRPPPWRGPVLLAGDAASLINPLTGEGIFYAIASGRLAGLAAARRGGAAGGLYDRLLQRRLARHLRHTAVLARLLEHPSFVAAAIAAARDPDVFDDVAEVGLGEGLVSRRTAVRVAGHWLRTAAIRSSPPSTTNDAPVV